MSPVLTRRTALLTGLAAAASAPVRAEAAGERIARVEAGLLGDTVIVNRPGQTRRLADEMARLKVPAVQAAVIDQGRLAWSRAWGVATPGGPPVSPDSLFQAGSVSKSLTALAALQLVEQGRLDLDGDVRARLRSWAIPQSPFLEREAVTVRRLLSHSAGFNVHGFDGYARGAPVPSLRQVLDGAAPANSEPIRVTSAPGAGHRYSGGGFTVLQQLMIDATGRPFEALLRHKVLASLGMADSGFEPLAPARARRAALGHRADGRAVEGGWHAYPEMAAASLWSTAADLARFVLGIQAARAGRSRLLGRALALEMTRRQAGDAGLGVFLKGEPAYRFSHNGATEGYACVYAGFLERGQGAVVMTNSDAGAELTSAVLRSVAREYGWDDMKPVEKTVVEVAPDRLAAYAGRYRFEGGGVFVVRLEQGRLFGGPEGRTPMELYPEAADRFFLLLPGGATLTFLLDGDRPTGLVLNRRGRDDRAARE
jgi:CubicO group peptidase (beta-lactamase class C family)